jgi:hypothetical protein
MPRIWFSFPRILGIRPGISFSLAELPRSEAPEMRPGAALQRKTRGRMARDASPKQQECALTKEDMIQRLPVRGPWRKYVREWTNQRGDDNGLNGHIMAIWPNFWRKCYKDSPRKLSKA